MNTLDRSSIKKVFLLGATGGIGKALVERLLSDDKDVEIYTLTRKPISRDRVHNVVSDRIGEAELAEFLQQHSEVRFDLIINAIGALETEYGGPEKSLRDISEERLLESFRVNSVLTPVLAKVIRTNLRSTGFAFIALSAMVGSIGENELGGWYGYRASKAALNAFIKNISIEWGREHPNSLVLAIHPGTTKTALSEKFSSRVTHKIHSPEEAAENILNVIYRTEISRSGSFLNWDGRTIEW